MRAEVQKQIQARWRPVPDGLDEIIPRLREAFAANPAVAIDTVRATGMVVLRFRTLLEADSLYAWPENQPEVWVSAVARVLAEVRRLRKERAALRAFTGR